MDAYDINGRTPLMIAAACNLVTATKMLMEAGGRSNTIDNMGHSIIDYVLKYGCVSVSIILDDPQSATAAAQEDDYR
jgi:ankyrin repeat protein